jgi:methyl-accepting chemotaxis protein
VIEAIQKGTWDNMKNVDEADKAVQTATGLAGESGRALEEIVSLAEDASAQVASIVGVARQQAASGERIKKIVDEVHGVSSETAAGMGRTMDVVSTVGGEIEELVKLSGLFRLIGEGAAQSAVEDMAGLPAMQALDTTGMERAMRRAVAENTIFELLYATDSRGRQVTENIEASGFKAKGSTSVKGKDWSRRPWFTGVIRNNDTYISPLYLSEASGDYCLTISTPVLRDNALVGVLAADIKVFS